MLGMEGLKFWLVYGSVRSMKNNKIIKRGKIDITELNVPPEKHEYETAKYFADRGLDVIFIKPSDIKGQNSPDFQMVDKTWETKSPITYSKTSFEYVFRKAIKQSKHIIYDLRRLNEQNEEKYIRELCKWCNTPTIRTLLIITRDGRLLTLKGRFDSIKLKVARPTAG